MLLRRVTKHVKDQNWTAVGIDFFIVVFGVFIGLQVNNWNEARQDRADELRFLERLHPEIVRVEESSVRVRDRRIAVIDDLRSATEAIFGVSARDQLTPAECMALATSHYYNINVLGLPSVVELENSGRISIIRDAALRTALVEYEQRVDTFTVRQNDQSLSNNLLNLNPQLVKVKPTFDSELGEMQTLPECDLAAMKEDQAFLNAVAENLDAYDAYLRDGLLPWDAQLKEVHRLVDEALAITHE